MARPPKFDRVVMLDKAMRLFWRKGYELTSIQDLTQALTIHPGTLYDTFGDKKALFLEAFDRYVETVGFPILTVLQQPEATLTSIQLFFSEQYHLLLSNEGKWGCLITNTAIGLGPFDPLVTQKVANYQTTVETIFVQLIDKAQTVGEISPRSLESIWAMARLLNSCLQGMRVVARTNPDAKQLDDIVRGVTNLLTDLSGQDR
ncbi:TetR/AcrR family transcriptional regulator [Spirosoma flavum]|uniref:TetR/AcrR family transcriptional regulator n=1 Tax=Spirosoma flavum TaxID=2048557 RepID=A0ABW6AI82_9BACT